MGGAVAAAPPAAPSEGGSHDGDVFEQWQRQMVHAWTDTDYKLCSFKCVTTAHVLITTAHTRNHRTRNHRTRNYRIRKHRQA